MPTTTSQSREELAASLQQKDQEIQAQLDRIYQLVDAGTPEAFLKVEYKHAVEKITEKYQLVMALLDSQRTRLDDQAYVRASQNIQAQLKEEVILLASAIDQAVAVRRS